MSERPRKKRKRKRLRFESLEPRCLLAADVRINEFVASNSRSLDDGDGNSSDWIELHNAGDESLDLAGYYLTDDPNALTRWPFPQVTLEPNAYLVVFASGQATDGYVDAGGHLHTNFALSASGEYLALVAPDGMTVISEFAPAYPEQQRDISYGVAQRDTFVELLAPSAPGAFWVPDHDLNSAWTGGDEPFDDSGWQTATMGVGYETPPPDEIVNVALHKPALQSTNGFGLAATGAVDGNHAGNSISHTATGDLNPWWEVDLTEDYALESIDVVTRANCCTPDNPERDYNLTVEIRDAGDHVLYESAVFNPWDGTGGAADDVGNGAVFHVDLTGLPEGGVTGRKVRVAKQSHGGRNHSEWLQLAEVEVLAKVPQAGPYAGMIASNVEAAMRDVNATAYVRLPFNVPDAGVYDQLTFDLHYDDGFVAYLNGTEFARANAPAGEPPFDAAATTAHDGATSQSFVVPASLLVNGANVLAIQGLNGSPGDDDFLLAPTLTARIPASGHGYFPQPTPGAPNSEHFEGLVADTTFDVKRGYFDTAFDVHVTTRTPGATIIYTTDGSPPSPVNGIQVPATDPAVPPVATVPVTTTTTLRAAAFKSQFAPSNIDTQTYLFLDDVIRQPADPGGVPLTWNGFTADFEMDPDVVDDTNYTADLLDGLRSIPTLSVVAEPDAFWSSTDGIYIFPERLGVDYERPVSLEWINPDGSTLFQEDAGIRVWGTGWRPHSSTLKHSFQLKFKSDYGETKLRYPIFPDAPVEAFDDLVLRAQGSRGWTDFRSGNLQIEATQYIHDSWARDTARDMGKIDGHATYVHLYINGLYWGLYNPVERPTGNFGEEYFGGSNDDYDVISHRVGQPVVANEGDLQAWNAMQALADAGLGSSAAYQAIQEYVDIDNLIDYMLINQYATNHDGPASGNNLRALRRREPGERQREQQYRRGRREHDRPRLREAARQP